MNYENGLQTTSKKTIEIRGFQLDLTDGDISGLSWASRNRSIDTQRSFRVQLEALEQNMTKYVSTAERAIQLIPVVVMSGGKRVMPSQQDSITVSFTPPTEDENGELQFTDIMLQVTQYGNYQIMILVDGIESPISGSITVEEVPFSIGVYVISFYLSLMCCS